VEARGRPNCHDYCHRRAGSRRGAAGRPTDVSVAALAQATVRSVDPALAPADAPEWPREGLERVSRCPTCDSPARHLLYSNLVDRSYSCAPGRWKLFRCEGCSCAYLDPRPDEQTAHLAYASYYNGADESLPDEPTGIWRRLRRGLRNGYLNSRYGYDVRPASALGPLAARLSPRHRETADEYVRHLHKPEGNARLLDVGCGEGEFLAGMQALGWSVDGIEPSGEAVSIARKRNLPVVHGALADVDLADRSFDAITFRLVFEHLREPRVALEACRRALKPEGVLWIATPNLASEGHRLFGEHWIHVEPPRHPVVHTPDSAMHLLARSGFELTALLPSRQAVWSFRMSAALAQNLPPFANPPPLPARLALRARLADLRALRLPDTAEILILVARAR
jgi:SAM-dependent methyltransferase